VTEGDQNELYSFASGGGKIDLSKGLITYKVNFTDPEGQVGILKLRGNVTVTFEDGLATGTFAVTNIEAVYIQGDHKDKLNYQNAAITLDADARLGSFSFEAQGTTVENGEMKTVTIKLSGFAKGFINAPLVRWNAREGSWSMGDETYVINAEKNNPGAVKTDSGEIRYNGNFLKQGQEEAGNGKFRGKLLDPITLTNGKVSGTFKVQLDKAVYTEDDGTKCVVTITSATITFNIQ